MQVQGCERVTAKPLPAQYSASMASSSIIDSGTNGLVLAPDVYQAVVSSLDRMTRGRRIAGLRPADALSQVA